MITSDYEILTKTSVSIQARKQTQKSEFPLNSNIDIFDQIKDNKEVLKLIDQISQKYGISKDETLQKTWQNFKKLTGGLDLNAPQISPADVKKNVVKSYVSTNGVVGEILNISNTTEQSMNFFDILVMSKGRLDNGFNLFAARSDDVTDGLELYLDFLRSNRQFEAMRSDYAQKDAVSNYYDMLKSNTNTKEYLGQKFGESLINSLFETYSKNLSDKEYALKMFDKLFSEIDNRNKKFYTENKKIIDSYDKFANNTSPYKLEFPKANVLNFNV
ncbi:hypothetical protein U5B43_10395 [Campylobacter sp. 9BO]|uniref:hypothetical protein n=1 Tax=Campylobacter sp. 9BO TaxID=3424759 RepID=UPI003D32BD20